MAKLKVLTNHLLVQIEKKKEQVVNGLIIPSSNTTMHVDAVVVAVGEAVKGVAEGDTVIIPVYAGLDLEVDKVNYKVICDVEVMVVIELEVREYNGN